MKGRIIKNKCGKFQPQCNRFGIWWNHYGGYADDLIEFDTLALADEFISNFFNKRKLNNQTVIVVKEYAGL